MAFFLRFWSMSVCEHALFAHGSCSTITLLLNIVFFLFILLHWRRFNDLWAFSHEPTKSFFSLLLSHVVAVDVSMFMAKLNMTSFEWWWWCWRDVMHTTNQLHRSQCGCSKVYLILNEFLVVDVLEAAQRKVLIYQLQWTICFGRYFLFFRSSWMFAMDNDDQWANEVKKTND